MSTLRQRLRSPVPYLSILVAGALAVALDAARPASDQLSARVYLLVIEAYQRHGRPVLEGRVACRYRPSCSEYSREAVARHGIAKGLKLTAHRLSRCKRSVNLGTSDPVPIAQLLNDESTQARTP